MRILLIYLDPLKNEPIGLMYIGTVLEREGHTVRIIDVSRHNPSKSLLKTISHFNPAIVGISITTPLAHKAEEVAKVIKQFFQKTIIIAGGPHATMLPHETLKTKNIDICVIGEGELTIVELVRTLARKDSFANVNGIAYMHNGTLVMTPQREYIADLDTLPFVDRELMPKEVIYGRAGYPLGNPCMFVMGIRGCPYQCSFCQPGLQRIFGKKVRRRSPENIFAEIAELKRKYGINGLWINDDTFLFDYEWVDKFCNLLIQGKLHISWHTNGRINNANKNILTKIRDAGCVTLVMTPESGSSRIRNEVLNKNVSDDEIIKAYSICHEIGLPAQANIMLASPTETKEELAASIKLIKRIQPHFMNFSYTTALPGTYLSEKYSQAIVYSPYYQNYEGYDIGRLKKLDTEIHNSELQKAWNFFDKWYSRVSLSNRARHFFGFSYFRKIVLRRWKTLLLSRHPKFRHFIFDVAAIVVGSVIYFTHLKNYKENSL